MWEQEHSKRFVLHRHTDASGISGTGTVADGVMFPDGVCVLRWRGEHRSTVIWATIADVIAVHGHSGATTVVWRDK